MKKKHRKGRPNVARPSPQFSGSAGAGVRSSDTDCAPAVIVAPGNANANVEGRSVDTTSRVAEVVLENAGAEQPLRSRKWIDERFTRLVGGCASALVVFFLSIDQKVVAVWVGGIVVVATLFYSAIKLQNWLPKQATMISACRWLALTAVVVLLSFWTYGESEKRKLRDVEDPGFKITCLTSIALTSNTPPHFWLLQSVTNREIVSPVSYLFYVRLTNLRPTPLLIDSYGIAIGYTNGSWQPLPIVDLMAGRLYFASFGTDFVNAVEINMRSKEAGALHFRRSIPPNETASGWLAFEAPDDVLAGTRMRFIASDVNSARRYVKDVMTSPPLPQSFPTLPAGLHLLGKRDISEVPRIRFSSIPMESRYYAPIDP